MTRIAAADTAHRVDTFTGRVASPIKVGLSLVVRNEKEELFTTPLTEVTELNDGEMLRIRTENGTLYLMERLR